MPQVRIGATLLGRYVLVRLIGQGGVSRVFEAVDTVAGRTAAVKVPCAALAADPRTRAGVRREAQIIDRLRHPTVPRVYHVGETVLGSATGEPVPVPCLAMERVTGEPLTRRLADGPLPWPLAVEVAATLAETLAVAHRRGIVHRDLAPDNVLLTRTGVKIVDFGLAATGTDGDSGRPADDVHALGALLHQMLTGRSPYPYASPGAGLAAARVGRPTAAPVLAVPGLPASVAQLCRRCLAPRPLDRPASATVALALWSVLIAPQWTLCGRHYVE